MAMAQALKTTSTHVDLPWGRKWSHTQLSMADDCLRKWHQRYVLGKKQPPTDMLVHGRLIHHTLELYTRQALSERNEANEDEEVVFDLGQWQPEDRIPEFYEVAVRNLSPVERDVYTDDEADALIDLAIRGAYRIPLGRRDVRCFSENEFSVDVSPKAILRACQALDVDPELIGAHQLGADNAPLDTIRGKIDLLVAYLGQPRAFEIRDYKTGWNVYDPDPDEHWQLPLYGSLVKATVGKAAFKLDLHFLRDDKGGDRDGIRSLIVKSTEDTNLVFAPAWRKAVRLIVKVRAAAAMGTSAFTASPGSHCRYCHVAIDCPVVTDAATGQVPQATDSRESDDKKPNDAPDDDGPIETMDDAVQVAKELQALDRARKDKKARLKAWVEATGQPVAFDDRYYGWYPRRYTSWNTAKVLLVLLEDYLGGMPPEVIDVLEDEDVQTVLNRYFKGKNKPLKKLARSDDHPELRIKLNEQKDVTVRRSFTSKTKAPPEDLQQQ